MDNLKLPKTRPSAAARHGLSGLTGDVDTFLPKTLSRQAQKRANQALEETYVRVVVTKCTAVMEQLLFTYRSSAKRYELTEFRNNLLYYQSLLDEPQPKAVKAVMEQAVQQFISDLYAYMWDLSQNADEETQKLILGLYPEKQEERDWLKNLGVLFR